MRMVTDLGPAVLGWVDRRANGYSRVAVSAGATLQRTALDRNLLS